MKRLIAGIVLASLGGLAVLGDMTALISGRVPSGSFATGCIAAIIGVVLISFGRRHVQAKKTIEAMAVKMMRERGDIDSAKIASAAGISEADVNRLVKQGRDEGAIPQ